MSKASLVSRFVNCVLASILKNKSNQHVVRVLGHVHHYLPYLLVVWYLITDHFIARLACHSLLSIRKAELEPTIPLLTVYPHYEVTVGHAALVRREYTI